jgi:hypothetical protein
MSRYRGLDAICWGDVVSEHATSLRYANQLLFLAPAHEAACGTGTHGANEFNKKTRRGYKANKE